MNKAKVYITGHKNPDTDSICAALAYAHLLNELDIYEAIPIRLGEVSPETRFILDYFNLDAPRLMTSIKPRVKDLELESVPIFSRKISLNEAWEEMEKNGIKTAVVADWNDHLIGVVSSTTIVEGYMKKWNNRILAVSKTPIQNIVNVLKASELVVKNKNRYYQGELKVVAMDQAIMQQYIKQDDIVIVGGGRPLVYKELIHLKVGLIILTGDCNLSDALLEKAKENQVDIISTCLDTYNASRLITQSIPLNYIMKKEQLVAVTTEDLLDDIKKIMASTRYRSYPVVDRNTNKVVGAISRYHLVNDVKKKLIQVDHNERSQSIKGIEEADVIEIIDHHRVADVQTSQPVYFRNEPLGSTSTIIAKIYRERGMVPPADIAGILCAAIISDTLLFKSPTCTPVDIEIAYQLADLANIQINLFADKMFTAGTALKGRSVKNIFNTDFKTFFVEDKKVGIAQVNTMDIKGFMPIKNEMIEYMDNIVEDKNYDVLLLLLTDVIEGGSYVVGAGKYAYIVEKAFDCQFESRMVYIPKVVSRKKQMLPNVIRVLTSLDDQLMSER